MKSSRKQRRVEPVAVADEEFAFPWLLSALAISGLSLFFEIFPDAWWSVVSFAMLVLGYLDIRAWSWRSYAVVCVIAIAVLVFNKNRQENS